MYEYILALSLGLIGLYFIYVGLIKERFLNIVASVKQRDADTEKLLSEEEKLMQNPMIFNPLMRTNFPVGAGTRGLGSVYCQCTSKLEGCPTSCGLNRDREYLVRMAGRTPEGDNPIVDFNENIGVSKF